MEKINEKFSPASPLSFQPVTQGLGFHPFSDGLPYAPVVKSPSRPQPVGASVAGEPRFVFPEPRRVVSAPAAPPVQIKAARVETPQFEPVYGWVYGLKRVCAFILDSVLNIGIAWGALGLALWKQNISSEMLLNPGIVLVASVFVLFFNWALITAQEVAFGTSLGKRVFGLKIEASVGVTVLRAALFALSLGLGGLGLVFAFFDKKGRCWHDLVSGVHPHEIARL